MKKLGCRDFPDDCENIASETGPQPDREIRPEADLYPNGGSVALGHPFGATGARILSQAVRELATLPKGSRAVVSVCADGGLGTVALLENS